MNDMRQARHIALLTLLVAAAGCAGAGAESYTTTATVAPDEATPGGPSSDYQAAARALYQSAVKALKGHDYTIAISRFDQVRNRYPYSRYAPLSEIGLADTLFDQGRYLEAADAYRTFVRLRPAHPQVDYAAWREALSLSKEAPTDFFVMPPAYEKDLSQVKQLQRVLSTFLETYPESDYRDEARALLDEARLRLANHEMYVAGFYSKREKWRGAAGRLENVLARYSDLPVLNPARVELADVYLHLLEPRPKAARTLVTDALAADDLDPEVRSRARALEKRIAALPPEAFEGDEPPPPTLGTELEPVKAPEGGYAPPKEEQGQGQRPGGAPGGVMR